MCKHCTECLAVLTGATEGSITAVTGVVVVVNYSHCTDQDNLGSARCWLMRVWWQRYKGGSDPMPVFCPQLLPCAPCTPRPALKCGLEKDHILLKVTQRVGGQAGLEFKPTHLRADPLLQASTSPGSLPDHPLRLAGLEMMLLPRY